MTITDDIDYNLAMMAVWQQSLETLLQISNDEDMIKLRILDKTSRLNFIKTFLSRFERIEEKIRIKEITEKLGYMYIECAELKKLFTEVKTNETGIFYGEINMIIEELSKLNGIKK